MANRPKRQGTARETWFVRRVAGVHGLTAQRSPNNSPNRDVDLQVGDTKWIIEVKDRQQLNVHKVLAESERLYPDNPVAVVWHRMSKKKGGSRRTPDGPTLVALPVDLFLSILSNNEGEALEAPDA